LVNPLVGRIFASIRPCRMFDLTLFLLKAACRFSQEFHDSRAIVGIDLLYGGLSAQIIDVAADDPLDGELKLYDTEVL